MILKTLRRLKPNSSQTRRRRFSHFLPESRQIQSLEGRLLLAAQIVSTDPAGPISVSSGSEFGFDVNIDTDPAGTLGNGLSFAFHYDAENLTFVRLENIFSTPAPTIEGNPVPDTGDRDGIGETDTLVPNTWSTFTSFTFPASVTAFRAVFEATGAFDAGTSTQIGFSQVSAPVDSTGNTFDFLSTPLTVNSVEVIDPPPVAVDDALTVRGGQTVTGNVTDNDSDPDGQALTVALVTDVTDGTLTLGSDGEFSYTPNDGFVGTDSFEYSVTDTANNTVTATATITVTDVPDIDGDGNIFVAWFRGSLFLLGDNGNNSVLVTEADGVVTVIGLGNTTINGSSDAFTISVPQVSNDLRIAMRGGNDTVIVQDLTIADNVRAALNRGDDRIVFDNVTVGGSLVASGGLGDDAVIVNGARIGGDVRIGGASGSDAVWVNDAQIGDDLIVRGGGKSDVIIVDNSAIRDDVILLGGARNDMIGLSETSVGGNLDVRGQGGRDMAQLNNVSVGGRQKVRSVAFGSSAIDSAFSDARQRIADALLALG